MCITSRLREGGRAPSHYAVLSNNFTFKFNLAICASTPEAGVRRAGRLGALCALRDAPGPDSATTMTTHTLDTPWPRTAVSGVVSRPSVNMSIRGRYVLTSHAVHKFAPFYSMRWELQAFTGHGLLVVMVRILVGALVIDLLRLGREPRCDSARAHPVTEWKLPEVARLHAWWFTEGWREGHCAKDNKNGNKRGSSQDNRAPGKKLQTRNNRITFDRWG